ncbi:transcriptional regulator [Alienimonas californiensis]|uniref:Helix-turn-helix domain protein n=1 Tax=Alienimonas californiensis TaxID=2527989 RepID=A0A517P7W3_9PLAN|nr:transcriptional regulator [Alienimonas californiensis]QDT15452.1 Helix-turn-helix domain protein [Alienimonas californiensis]
MSRPDPEKLSEQERPAAPPSGPGRFDYAGLDRVLHERARLGILTSLLTHPEGLLFGEVRDLCGLTDGNLNRHLSALDEAGLIELWKRGAGRGSRTLCKLSPTGRERFLAYLAELERVLADAAPAAEGAARLKFAE